MTHIHFHNCTAREFRVDGTYTDGDTHYDFTLVYDKVNEEMNHIEWTEDEPEDKDKTEDSIFAEFWKNLNPILASARLTQSEHPVITSEHRKYLEKVWNECYGELLSSEYTGFWEAIGGSVEHTYEEWMKEFSPIKNDLNQEASFDGYMFETFGDEWRQVCVTNPRKVWTIIEAEDKRYVVAGLRIVNRIGYFITKRMWKENHRPIDYLIS